MYPKEFQLKNIRGIESLTFSPGSFNVISGKNGAGKSSILAALTYMGEKSHDPDMLRTGCDKGEIRLVIGDEDKEYDGASFVCTVTPSKTQRVLLHPKLGKIPVAKSKEWFESVVNMVSMDPVRFLSAKEDEQLQIFLEAIPQRVAAEQLGFVSLDIIKKFDLDQHALTVIDGIRGEIYEARKDKNTIARDKRATARTTREGLPADPPEGNWSEIFATKSAEKQTLFNETRERAQAIEGDAELAEKAQDELLAEKVSALEKERDEAIEKIKADTEIAISHVSKAHGEAVKSINKEKDSALEAAREEYAPKSEALVQEITTAQNMIDAQAKAQSSRELADKMDAEAEALEKESKSLTEQIDKLNDLKKELLSSLPIPGLEVKDGRLYNNDIPFRTTNSAERFRIMFEVGKLLSGPMGFMVMDNSELLDDENWPDLVEAGKKAGMTVMAARRTTGPLEITTEGREVA